MIDSDALTAAEFQRELPRLVARGYRFAIAQPEILPSVFDAARGVVVYKIRQRVSIIPPSEPRFVATLQG